MEHNSQDTVQSRAKRKLERDMGPQLLRELNDRSTVELLLNPDGNVWVEKLGEPMQCIGTMPSHQAQAILETVAGFHGKVVTSDTPVIEAEFPLDGSRFEGLMPPVVTAPCFTLRKPAVAIFTLEQYVAAEIMTADQHHVLLDAIRDHRNILIVGGTGSGKTTLLNAVIHEIVQQFPAERMVILEDTREIQCAAKNFVQLRASPTVPMSKLLRATLRMRPDRILVGEVRGPEALDLLMSWNTGHPGGVATIHADANANSDMDAGLARLSLLVSMHPDAPRSIESFIGQAVHLLVYIARTPTGRRVREIRRVGAVKDGNYETHSLA